MATTLPCMPTQYIRRLLYVVFAPTVHSGLDKAPAPHKWPMDGQVHVSFSHAGPQDRR